MSEQITIDELLNWVDAGGETNTAHNNLFDKEFNGKVRQKLKEIINEVYAIPDTSEREAELEEIIIKMQDELDKKLTDDDPDFDDIVYLALRDAKRAFNDTLSKHLYDSAFCDIRFTVWVKDATFEHRLRRMEIEDELKE